MDDVFSSGETAWDLVHDRSYFLLRKKHNSSSKDPTRCYLLFFICGFTSIASWFALGSNLLFYDYIPSKHFLYYFSAYTIGSLAVLALHKNYEQNMSKKDFSKAIFFLRMFVLALYNIVVCIVFAFYNFSAVFSFFAMFGLGICHGALLGGLSQLSSVFPSPYYGHLLLGVDFAWVIPFIITLLLSFFPSSDLLFQFLYITPAVLSAIGVLSLFFLLRSDMAKQFLGKAKVIQKENAEGLESLLRSEDADAQYVSLSSFVSQTPTPYKDAFGWGAIVFVCSFCTYIMIPYFPEARKTGIHFAPYLFFAQHVSSVLGREAVCGIVKNAVKGKLVTWLLVILRALIIAGLLVELRTCPIGGIAIGAMEVVALVLVGLVGGAVSPAVYTLACLRISDDIHNSSKVLYVCMWCSVAGAIAALAVWNGVSVVQPNLL